MTADRVGKVVMLTIAGDYSISDAWGTTTVCKLPWKPATQVFFAITLQDGLSGVIGQVDGNGYVIVNGKGTQWRKGWLFGSATYVVA